MPVTYVCKHCGYELYRFERVGQSIFGLRTPEEVRALYHNKCPNCGHELGKPNLEDIRIEPVARVRRALG